MIATCKKAILNPIIIVPNTPPATAVGWNASLKISIIALGIFVKLANITMNPETIAELANNHKNIFAVKQSLANMDIITETRKLCPDDFVIYSGDDSLTLPMVSVGAYGVISVASHIIGNQMHEMLNLYKSGNVKAATDMHLKLYPLFKKIFMAPNPVPVKECLSKMGIIKNYVRCPLVELDADEKKDLYSVLEQYI